tara:strand:+ start:191 stop:400 length:210 start_codon:yes stop_codon:yes gene_type:complete
MKLLLSIFLISFILTLNAYAYIDPGSGSIILQALLGALAAIGASISIYWSKFKNLFKRKKKIEKDKKEN